MVPLLDFWVLKKDFKNTFSTSLPYLQPYLIKPYAWLTILRSYGFLLEWSHPPIYPLLCLARTTGSLVLHTLLSAFTFLLPGTMVFDPRSVFETLFYVIYKRPLCNVTCFGNLLKICTLRGYPILVVFL